MKLRSWASIGLLPADLFFRAAPADGGLSRQALTQPGTAKQCRIANDLNLRSVLGSHAINDEVGCYSYRATHWLDTELDAKRFYEILDRCVDRSGPRLL